MIYPITIAHYLSKTFISLEFKHCFSLTNFAFHHFRLRIFFFLGRYSNICCLQFPIPNCDWQRMIFCQCGCLLDHIVKICLYTLWKISVSRCQRYVLSERERKLQKLMSRSTNWNTKRVYSKCRNLMSWGI